MFEYKVVNTDQKSALELQDCYEALGWELVGKNNSSFTNSVSLEFKRNRELKYKNELNRLEMKIDDAFCSIEVLEKKKSQKAATVSLITGVIGTLIFGGGLSLCLTPSDPKTWIYVVGVAIALIGVIPCGLSYLAYKRIYAKSKVTMNTLIDRKRDEISELCKEASSLR